MKLTRFLVLSLLTASCASTSSPEPTALRAFGSPLSLPPLPRVVAQPAVSSDGVGLLGLGAVSAVSVAQETSEARPEPQDRHSFRGGLGVRVRDGDAALSLQGQYHYYVNPVLDLGVIADWAGSPIDTFLIAPAVWWMPNEKLTLLAAPGFEFESGEGSEAAMRVGGSYRMALENWFIRPFVYYDFVEERDDSVMFGVAVGF